MNNILWFIGALVIANIGTMLVVVIAALKLASIFGGLRKHVKVHEKRLDSQDRRFDNHGNRILDLERAR